jgi:hypothetical protein
MIHFLICKNLRLFAYQKVNSFTHILDKHADLLDNGDYLGLKTINKMLSNHTARKSYPQYVNMNMLAMDMCRQIQAAAVEDRA